MERFAQQLYDIWYEIPVFSCSAIFGFFSIDHLIYKTLKNRGKKCPPKHSAAQGDMVEQ